MDEGYTRRLFSPDGTEVTRVWAHTWNGLYIESVQADGTFEEGGTDGDTNLDGLLMPWGSLVNDQGAGDWLSTHCRVVEVPHDMDDPTIEAWSDEIVSDCTRVRLLREATYFTDLLKGVLPTDYADSTTLTVFDAVVTKRIETDIEQVEARIAAYRATRTEPTRVEEPEEDETQDQDVR